MAERPYKLITKAYADKLIDYSQYRRYDTNWELRELIAFKAIDQALALDVAKNRFNFLGHALSAVAPQTENSVNIYNELVEAQRTIFDILLPWHARKVTDKTVIKEAAELWQDFEQFQETETFKNQMAANLKIFNKQDADKHTDMKLAEILNKPTITKSTKTRIPFNA